jgi:hypothetical protein
MKLKPLPPQDGVSRLSLSIRSSTSASLDDYLKFYEQSCGHSIEKSRLVDAILKEYFESDSSFRAFRKTGGTKGAGARTDAQPESQD